ncbi:unnamed protein product [Linum trigynum]|uniref:Uncharacterized protein n=1 Tax=Linum trigynum TaxID=586398 RepID=A0AAV2G8Q2_9ROSI
MSTQNKAPINICGFIVVNDLNNISGSNFNWNEDDADQQESGDRPSWCENRLASRKFLLCKLRIFRSLRIAPGSSGIGGSIGSSGIGGRGGVVFAHQTGTAGEQTKCGGPPAVEITKRF